MSYFLNCGSEEYVSESTNVKIVKIIQAQKRVNSSFDYPPTTEFERIVVHKGYEGLCHSCLDKGYH